MAGNTLENLELTWNRAGLPVKYGKRGSHKVLDGFALRFWPNSRPSDRQYGVQEVAGSNPVAPTFARPVGTTSSDWPFSHLGGSFRPPGQSCGQRFDRSVPPDILPLPLDSWLLPPSQRYSRAGSSPSLCEHQAPTLGHK